MNLETALVEMRGRGRSVPAALAVFGVLAARALVPECLCRLLQNRPRWQASRGDYRT